MSQFFRSKLLSALSISALCLGVMVMIVQEGPEELPYYDGTLKAPLTSPMINQLYSVPQIDEESYQQQYAATSDAESAQGQEYREAAPTENQPYGGEAYDAGGSTYDASVESAADESDNSSYTSRAE